MSDFDPGTVESERKYRNGHRCIAVAAGDCEGNGRKGYVFLVVSPGRSVKALVALQKNKGWQVHLLWDMASDYAGCCYANVLPPGEYQNFYGSTPDPDQPPVPDELLLYKSTTEAPVVGSIESTGIAFFLSNQRWLHIWISD